MDADASAGHVDGDVFVAESDAVSDGGSSAAAGSRCEGIAGAAFPNFNADVVAVDDLKELERLFDSGSRGGFL